MAGRLIVLRDVTDYLQANEAARAAAWPSRSSSPT